MKITWSLPLELPNPKNHREHWRVRSKRTQEHRGFACAKTNVAMPFDTSIPIPPYKVTITRIGPRLLDDDNVAFSASAVRDGISQALGVDDGDKKSIRFKYKQKKGEYGVEVLIEWKG